MDHEHRPLLKRSRRKNDFTDTTYAHTIHIHIKIQKRGCLERYEVYLCRNRGI